MRFLDRHILPLGRLFVLLFFLANTGFTVVLYHCTMQDMGCCGSMKEEMSGSCSMMDMPQPSNGPSVSSGEKCQTLIVAGGLKTDPTVVEKAFTLRGSHFDHTDYVVPVFALATVDSQNQTHFFISSPNVSPPAVEKYVLASSFLI